MIKIKYIVGLLFFIFSHLMVMSQVTIGSNSKPKEGVLLDVRDQVRDNQGITSTTGGVLLPCVELVSENTLEPFIKINDNEWKNENSNIKERHIGLIVYNLSTSFLEGKGLYSWNGTKWISYKPVYANNGLTITNDAKIKLGGSLIEDTEIDLNSNIFTIDAGNKTNLILQNLEPGVSASPLAVASDGTVGIAASTSSKAKVAFIQSTTAYEIKDPLLGTGELTQLNNGTGVTVPWNASTDFKVNTRGNGQALVAFNSSTNIFTIQEKATIEVSGHLVYLAAGEEYTKGIIVWSWGAGPLYLDGMIQLRKSGSSAWSNVSSNRLIIPNNKERDGKFRQFLNLPSALIEVGVGDQLRVVIKNASNPSYFRHTGVGFISLTENYSNPYLAIPWGSTISRSFKILVHN